MYRGILSLRIREIFQKQKKKTLKFTYLGKQIRKIWKIEKLREKKVDIMGKLSDNNDPKPYNTIHFQLYV